MKKVLFMLVAMAALMSGFASAEIIITMTEAGDGGILVSGIGSGIINTLGEENPGQTDPDEDQWDWDNFTTNYLNDAAVSDLDSDSTSGTMTNVTTGASVAITNMEIDSDINSSLKDDMELNTANMPSFTHGDEFTVEWKATYLASQVLFSGLNVGTHVLPGDPADDELPFGDISVVVVPEPMTLSLLGLGGLALLRKRRA